MLRKPRKVEQEHLIGEAFEDEEFVETSVLISKDTIDSLTSKRWQHLKSQPNDKYRTSGQKDVKIVENAAECNYKDDIGLVTNIKKSDALEVTSLPDVMKKFSLSSDYNVAFGRPGEIRVSEAQLFIERENKGLDCHGLRKLKKDSYTNDKTISSDFEADNDRGGSSYKKLNKKNHSKLRTPKKSFRKKFRKFMRKVKYFYFYLNMPYFNLFYISLF